MLLLQNYDNVISDLGADDSRCRRCQIEPGKSIATTRQTCLKSMQKQGDKDMNFLACHEVSRTHRRAPIERLVAWMTRQNFIAKKSIWVTLVETFAKYSFVEVQLSKGAHDLTARPEELRTDSNWLEDNSDCG